MIAEPILDEALTTAFADGAHDVAAVAADICQIDLQLPAIRTDGDTQMRIGLNPTTVADYADILFCQERILDWPFPPLVVFHDGEHYWLADGFHRLAAFRKVLHIENNPDVAYTLPALARPGTRRDAILYAAKANNAHGLRHSNADKRKAVETLLRDEEWRQWSDAQIARQCGVDPKTVGNIRHVLEVTLEIPDTLIRKRVDGAPVDTRNIGATRPARPVPAPAAARTVYDPPAEMPESPAEAASPRRDPIYAQVWALEHIVGNWLRAIEDQGRLDIAPLLMALRSGKIPDPLIAAVKVTLTDPYRKNDLIQAINNVIEQRQQEARGVANEAPAEEQPASHNVRSLLYTPPEDTNFRWALERATAGELEAVLAAIPTGTPGHKTRTAIVERRLRKLQAPVPTPPPIHVPTVNEMIADTEAAYQAMFAGDAPAEAPGTWAAGAVGLNRDWTPEEFAAYAAAQEVVGLPVPEAPAPAVEPQAPGLTAEQRFDRHWQYLGLRSQLREAVYALPKYEEMTGDFASRGPLLRLLEPMIATLDRHIAAYEQKGNQAP